MENKGCSAEQIKTTLAQIRERVAPSAKNGRVASYIPELAKSDPRDLAVSVTLLDGTTYSVGESNKRFTLQSISKLFSLLIALIDQGPAAVFSVVGKEPTGDPFNSIVKLEMISSHKPLNPMINAGAIAVSSLISGEDVAARLDKILTLLKRMAGNETIAVNRRVYQSERETAHRNRALAYFMKDSGILKGDAEEILDLYFLHCSIEVTTEDLSAIAAVLANNGVHPITGQQLVPAEYARICKSFMVTCGMYNDSGAFAINAGIPAKSGVAGGILAAVPNKLGIGVYSPALNEKGNSLAGALFLEELSKAWNLSIF